MTKEKIDENTQIYSDYCENVTRLPLASMTIGFKA